MNEQDQLPNEDTIKARIAAIWGVSDGADDDGDPTDNVVPIR